MFGGFVLATEYGRRLPRWRLPGPVLGIFGLTLVPVMTIDQEMEPQGRVVPLPTLFCLLRL